MDYDYDRLTNLQEYQFGTEPTVAWEFKPVGGGLTTLNDLGQLVSSDGTVRVWDDGTVVQGGSMVGSHGGYFQLNGSGIIKHNNAGLTATLVGKNGLQLRVLDSDNVLHVAQVSDTVREPSLVRVTDSGYVYGKFIIGEGLTARWRAFRWHDGELLVFSPESDGNVILADGNSRGEMIVNLANPGMTAYEGYFFNGQKQWQALGGTAMALNNRGQVAVATAQGGKIWQDGVAPISLGFNLGKTFLNDRGHLVTDIGQIRQHAPAGGPGDLPNPHFDDVYHRVSINGLNNNGEIIGSYENEVNWQGTDRNNRGIQNDAAFSWLGGKFMVEGGLYLESKAVAISNNGRIGIEAWDVGEEMFDDDFDGEPETPASVTQSRMGILVPQNDADGDLLPDDWEAFYNVSDPEADPDGDGLSNLGEYMHSTNPNSADSDGDQIEDGWEVAYGYDPRWSGDATLDLDGDGTNTRQESLAGTDPMQNPSPPATAPGSSPILSDPSGPPPFLGLDWWIEDKWDYYEVIGNQQPRDDSRPWALTDSSGSVVSTSGVQMDSPSISHWSKSIRLRLNQPATEAFSLPLRIHHDRNGVTTDTITFLTVAAGHTTSPALLFDPSPLAPGGFWGTIPPNVSVYYSTELYEWEVFLQGVVDLAPKLKDETGAEIVNSNVPLKLPNLNGMVEEDPTNNRIAHRELKVRIGQALKGKAVTWTLEPLFVPHYDPNGPNLPPIFRGEWSASLVAAHQNSFEASSVYGANGFEIASGEGGDAVAKTTVADDGFTAIRVNLPPIGFNQARVRIQIEGANAPMDLIDMEVPAVIVIDPGHGTGPHFLDSARIGGEGDDTGELEHAFALDLAQRTRTEIRAHEMAKKRNIRVFLTRENPTNISATARTKVARDNGCDVYMSIHFNDSTSRQHRDPFGMWDSTGNLNLEEDKALAIRLRQAVQAAIAEIEPAESRNADRSDYNSEHWESVLQKGLDTCSDLQDDLPYNGNVPGYTPCRAALIEIEWMSHSAADALFNTAPLKEQMRAATAKALADACIQDALVQPRSN